MPEQGRQNPKAFETLLLNLAELAGKELNVGWFAGNKYESGYNVAAAAAGNELGIASRSIPPRPFMRPAIAHNKQKWLETAARGAKVILRGTETTETVLGKLGSQISGDVQQAIEDVTAPPLSPITLWLRNWKRDNPDKTVGGRIVGEAARETKDGYKGPAINEKPLEDTSRMLESVTHEVVDAT